ncbi:MAG TPA: cytochrome C [Desulfomicrobiaceae bacterium]|nr:cytochrome C [Desulfomicrobiaceae bacterium]
MRWVLLGLVLVGLTLPALAQENRYVGSQACADCHEAQYASYKANSKKAHSSRTVQQMASDLTEEELKSCFACHATGYGSPGGFVSFEKTPDLADAGCEVCHGPGGAHVDSGGDTSLIKGRGAIRVEDCMGCHTPERVRAFGFKPTLYSGGH